MDIDPGLAALRPLGGFFVLRAAGDGGRSPAGTLPTLAEAYGGAKSDVYGDSIIFRVELVAQRLRTSELRVSASIAQQGLAARLWSVALGSAVLYGRIPDPDPALLHWDPAATAPDDLWLAEMRPLPGDAETLAAAVLDRHLEPLGETLRARYGVAAGLLRGNAGSALAGAARELQRWAHGSGRTDLAERARALTAELFTHPLLSATGTLSGTAFRRRSCCLYYRLPGGGVCGDCCFTRPPRSVPHSSPSAPSG
ncbi:(2Fe-2S)-binding protein [Streptomyces sp. V3I7]|uniref:(2Fe-2S)-binding protein n=1 Tax=Streptomyces sp. V3I7 TaxID=3042278 RepID=UPI0027895206|nr:(2Fe-2S)-binding protein [Streptomyces sp. V3I7]MDQ0994285.1 hypothetical protein [Streptomyces sp. V3I7]